MFLTEMDGLDASSALVILATNRPDTLDPAIVRDGRMDRKISVSRPREGDAQKIFALYLGKVPLHGLAKNEGVKDAAFAATAALFDDEHTVPTKLNGKSIDLPVQALVSGAMIEGIVQRAATFALHRDLDKKNTKATGVTIDDIHAAIRQTCRENANVDHTDAALDFIALMQADKLKQESGRRVSEAAE
jgi:SpoVK/Ycf46/Vps4 family AAA+-type ATPase